MYLLGNIRKLCDLFSTSALSILRQKSIYQE
ncbi:hypothetical protein EHRUM3_11000, partial [Ehrlichia ruminantium]